jgi:hypothetical protein
LRGVYVCKIVLNIDDDHQPVSDHDEDDTIKTGTKEEDAIVGDQRFGPISKP